MKDSFSPVVSEIVIGENGNEMKYHSRGITKFEYAAIHLLAGMGPGIGFGDERMVKTAISRAKLLLTELEKESV